MWKQLSVGLTIQWGDIAEFARILDIPGGKEHHKHFKTRKQQGGNEQSH